MMVYINGIASLKKSIPFQHPRRIDAYANNLRYANLVGHLMAAGNELVAIIHENKANEN